MRITKPGAEVGKCFFLGFGFEAVNRPGGTTTHVTRVEMMEAIALWLGVPGGSGVEDGSEEPAGALPKVFALDQNYPNPFNPQTSISFTVPGSEGDLVDVSLKVYSLRGRLVKTLVDNQQEAGYHTAVWDGHDEVGKKVSSGIYLYRLEAGEKIAVRKMVILK